MGIKATLRWVDMLATTVNELNERKHSRTKMAPNEMRLKKNHEKLKKFYTINYKTGTPKFRIGDTVRISSKRLPFDRLYDIKWSIEHYRVHSIGEL